MIRMRQRLTRPATAELSSREDVCFQFLEARRECRLHPLGEDFSQRTRPAAWGDCNAVVDPGLSAAKIGEGCPLDHGLGECRSQNDDGEGPEALMLPGDESLVDPQSADRDRRVDPTPLAGVLVATQLLQPSNQIAHVGWSVNVAHT